jgi:hypothetical protein
VHSNFPDFLVPLWGRYGFAWGGNYRHAFKDPMHLEFMGAPADADDKTWRPHANCRMRGQERLSLTVTPARTPTPSSPATRCS